MNKPLLLICAAVVGVSVMACAAKPSAQWQSDHYQADIGFYNKNDTEQDFSFGKSEPFISEYL